MAIGIKKAQRVNNTDIDRVLQDIYNTLNEIIKAVNSNLEPFDSAQGKIGDLRVNQEGFQYHDGKGWNTVNVIKKRTSSDPVYEVTNLTSDRSLDCNGALAQVADVLGTLIEDLVKAKVIK